MTAPAIANSAPKNIRPNSTGGKATGSRAATPRARGRPTLEEVAEIDGQLLDVALQEFLRHGYGGTSMTRIVKAAGISKTTLYSRYSSKEQLFRAIMFQQMDHALSATLLQLQAGDADLEKGLLAYADRSLEISFSGGLLGVNRLIYSESHRFPELGIAAAERTQIGVQQIADFIRQCAAAKGKVPKDADGAAEAFILMLRGYYVNVMLTDRPVSRPVRQEWVRRAITAFISDASAW
ncbi:TetR family transcriptional regulator [Novosphingobium sp. PhB165]|uniref:TetR/AcrR family transcriptional regulator n=1 Tax=Novosphingobium sp. PhB165 TaxID=2485105 RepID=UPI0010515342|nr:TetR/AcrR family transcriptional regulator [Novosphingobium sp. PhB165]TCM15347.1 TetR family transcriptional regulator [Novosphingobium sp. PhB165]